jgi:hypothetical protein
MLIPPLAVTRADLPGARPDAGVAVGDAVAVGGRVGATEGVGVAAGGRVTVAAAAASRLTWGDGVAAGVTRIWKPPQANVEKSRIAKGSRICQRNR